MYRNKGFSYTNLVNYNFTEFVYWLWIIFLSLYRVFYTYDQVSWNTEILLCLHLELRHFLLVNICLEGGGNEETSIRDTKFQSYKMKSSGDLPASAVRMQLTILGSPLHICKYGKTQESLSHPKKERKWKICKAKHMLISSTAVITSQGVSKHQSVHLMYTEFVFVNWNLIKMEGGNQYL